MHISSLRLHDFRSYKQVLIRPPVGVTVLVGENGAGKTNLLEAVHLCCLGKSHRTASDKELIRSGCETAAVQLNVERSDGEHQVGVRLFDESQRRRKLLYINGKTASRMGELMGHATCVIFSPEDLNLIRGGPDVRRRFLDMLLCQRQKAYFYALQSYQTALRHRNALLKSGDLRQLPVWDEEISKAAVPIVRLRRDVISSLHPKAQGHYDYIGGKKEEVMALSYEGHLCKSQDIFEDMMKGLQMSRDEDLRRQTTVFGPHRDEMVMTLSGMDMRSFASQGQVRTAALSLKLSAFDLLEESQGEPPLLLLDDVLSELDPERRRRLLSRIAHVQTLLTCTDLSDLTGASPKCVLKVNKGEVTQL